MKTIEYLGTGPNPIDVPKLKTEKPLSKGETATCSDDLAQELQEQGLFSIVEQSGEPIA